jgi:hypothetical protein
MRDVDNIRMYPTSRINENGLPQQSRLCRVLLLSAARAALQEADGERGERSRLLLLSARQPGRGLMHRALSERRHDEC